MYLIRLDDASDKMDVEKWDKMEKLLDKYNIKPIVGIIPNNKDKEFEKYDVDKNFWHKAIKWQNKNWTIAMHGYEHVYNTDEGGINPIQKRSEYAGLPLKQQHEKIIKGYKILKMKKLNPTIFFAPSHTFDQNTLISLKEKTSIHIISDTIANNIYYKDGFYFIPQQSGCVRTLPFKVVTFCYHPNTMELSDFDRLEKFIIKNLKKFGDVKNIKFIKRKLSVYDKLLRKIYFIRRK